MTRTQRQIETFRQGDFCIPVRDAAGRPCAGVPVSVEQEAHQFRFGCVVPDLAALAVADRERYRARLGEVFNRIIADPPPSPEPGVVRVDVAERVHLGVLRVRLDRLAAPGSRLRVHVWGEAVGLAASEVSTSVSEREAGRRVAELYTLCFAHPAVEGVVWHGFADGEVGARGGGLLRRDLAPRYTHKVLQKLIGSVWHTRAAGVTDADGCFRFRGYYGDYRLVADVGEPSARVETVAFRQ